MTRIFLCLVMACMTTLCATARDLVITMKDGTRYAYHLSSTEQVKMVMGDDSFTLNGKSYSLNDVQELRIFKQTPEDAIVVSVKDIHGEEQSGSKEIYDLSGRKVTGDTAPHGAPLKPGIYIINRRKVIVQ